MGRIRLFMYYTPVVEHFLRMAVRYDRVSNAPRDWFRFAKYWIDTQSESDREFIKFVFSYKFFETIEGLNCYESNTPLFSKRQRLAALEKQFTIDGGLIDENENN